MRELYIGEQVVRVRATPLALLFYKQEFKSDLIGDLTKLTAIEDDLSKLDTIQILQLVWAMAKADAFGHGSFPSFVEWLGSLDSVDFGNADFMTAVIEEATEGFFRSTAGGAKRPARRSKSTN